MADNVNWFVPYEGKVWCLLCRRWASPWHLQSVRHVERVQDYDMVVHVYAELDIWIARNVDSLTENADYPLDRGQEEDDRATPIFRHTDIWLGFFSAYGVPLYYNMNTGQVQSCRPIRDQGWIFLEPNPRNLRNVTNDNE